MFNYIKNHFKELFEYIKNNKKEYLTEPTTMIGLAFIFLSLYEFYESALTFDQSNGLLIVGVGLLYPQGGTKSKFISNILSAILAAIAAIHSSKDITNNQDQIKTIDTPDVSNEIDGSKKK